VTTFEHNNQGWLTREGEPFYVVDVEESSTDDADRFIAETIIWKTISTYDRGGNHLSTTDALGNTTRMAISGNMLYAVNPIGTVTQYEYDDHGNPRATVDVVKGRIQFNYDTSGNVTSIQDSGGRAITTTEYDMFGRPTATTDIHGVTRHIEYNLNGHPVGESYLWVDPAESSSQRVISTSIRYDPNDRILSTTDARGHETILAYDVLGRVSSSTDIMGNVYTTRTIYNSRGFPVELSVPVLAARGESPFRRLCPSNFPGF